MTAHPVEKNKPIIEYTMGGVEATNSNMSVKESLMNTHKNPMISPNTNTNEGTQKRNMTEQDPFQMSESASIVPGSDKGGSAVNLLSSQMGSSYQAS